MYLSIALDQFLIACRAEGLQPKTIRWYREKLSRLVDQLGTGCPIDQIGAMEIRQYLITVRDSGVSDHTVAAYDRALRRFFHWMILEYNLDPTINPMNRIRKPIKPRPAPNPMRFTEFVKMLHQCNNSQMGIRNRAMLLFLADTGARSG